MWGLRKGSGYQRLTKRRTQYKKISFLFWSGRKKASDWAAEKYSRCGVGKFQVLIRGEKCGRKRDQASFLGYQVDGGTVVKPRIIAQSPGAACAWSRSAEAVEGLSTGSRQGTLCPLQGLAVSPAL